MTKQMINYQQELNEQQYRVVTEGDGPCLVLAGAGSGKTRAVTYRVAYLLERGVAPEHVLLLTFTNKAADEMLGRVAGLCGAKPAGLWGGTFHKIGLQIIRRHTGLLGWRDNFSVIDAQDSRDLVKICIKEEGMQGVKAFPGAAAVCNILSFAQNAQMALEEVLDMRYSQYEKFADTLLSIAQRYAQKKRTAQGMDFDDLLYNVVRLLEQNEALRARYGEQFEYILVDEYQDTNALQARMVDLLVGLRKNVLVVGDDAQSIYSFRAADIQNIASFEKRYPGARVFKLEMNYRSTPQILHVANESIAHNRRQYKKTLTGICKDGEKPEVSMFNDTAHEAAEVGRHIRDLIDDGVPRSEIAVLFRSSFHSQELEMELVKRDIPYDFRGGMRFFERSHVKDVMAYLRLANNPKDAIAWMRVLSLYDGIGPKTAEQIIERVVALEELKTLNTNAVAAGLNARANAGWQRFAHDAAALRDAAGAPAPLIRAVIDSSYKEMLQKEHENYQERLEDLTQMAAFAERAKDLHTFLSETALQESYSARLARDGAEKDAPRVVLSTIHQAKGLEWDTVFVLRLAAGQFPNDRAVNSGDELEEERRLFYVAATRARKRLFLGYPLMVGYENPYLVGPSPFLQELPPSVFKEVDTSDIQYVDAEAPSPERPVLAREFLKSIDEL